MTSRPQQGHPYSLNGTKVICLERVFDTIKVAEVDESSPWPLGKPKWVREADLQPLPLRYLHGRLPEWD